MCGVCRSAGGDEFVAVERDRVTDNDGGGTGDLSVLAVRHVRYVTSVHFVSHPFTLYSPAIASSSGSICH